MNNIDPTSKVMNSIISNEAKVYKNCDIKNSEMNSLVSIGDFSRIKDSIFYEHCLIQRNNIIYGSKLGRYTYTGKNCTIWNSTIGNFCSISWNVGIGGANHDYERITTHSFLYSDDFALKPKQEIGYNRFQDHCIIGNDVWVAANACVCRGVTVGNGAVIAAGAIVTKNVEPYSIVAGVPAKKIKMRFDNETITLLNKSKWWDLPKEIIQQNYELFNCYANPESARAIFELCQRVQNNGAL